nr:MAG TPA: hypothetical protein [Caudoviricetes sp.]
MRSSAKLQSFTPFFIFSEKETDPVAYLHK